MNWYIRVRTEEQLETAARWEHLHGLLLDGDLAYGSFPQLQGKGWRIFRCLPEVARESRLHLIRPMIRDLPDPWGLVVRNLDELGMLQQMGYQGPLIGDSWLYAYNSQAVRFCLDLFPDMLLICSDELTDRELDQIRTGHGRMIMKVYGHQPLMITNQCINRNISGCREKARWFSDSHKERFLTLSHCRQCYSIIYNGKPTWMLDRLEQIRYENVLLDLTVEDARDTAEILRLAVSAGTEPEQEGIVRIPGRESYTRGHHIKGIE